MESTLLLWSGYTSILICNLILHLRPDFIIMCPRGRKKHQDPAYSYDSDSDSDRSQSPTNCANREADLESLRERRALVLERVREREQEIQQINAEAAEARRQLEARERLLQEQIRIRMARREFMEKWRAQKAAEGKGNSDDQHPPPGNSSA